VLKKPNRNSDVVDVPADNPVGTMDRFTQGLRRVLSAPKQHPSGRSKRRKKTKPR
jgi:hypothetical protein